MKVHTWTGIDHGNETQPQSCHTENTQHLSGLGLSPWTNHNKQHTTTHSVWWWLTKTPSEWRQKRVHTHQSTQAPPCLVVVNIIWCHGAHTKETWSQHGKHTTWKEREIAHTRAHCVASNNGTHLTTTIHKQMDCHNTWAPPTMPCSPNPVCPQPPHSPSLVHLLHCLVLS